MDYEGIVAEGLDARLGRRDRAWTTRTDMVQQICAAGRFYAHESCAQCTQCREGTAWTTKILERILDGQGKRRTSTAAARPRRQHDRQDDLRAERFVRHAGRERDQEVPRRVRGVHPREPLRLMSRRSRRRRLR